MVQSLLSLSGRMDKNPQVLLDLLLPDEILKPRGPKATIQLKLALEAIRDSDLLFHAWNWEMCRLAVKK